MFVSRPAVHHVEAPPLTDAAVNPPRVRVKNVQGMPATPGGLSLRFLQFAFAVAALGVMVSTSDFPSVTAFWSMLGLVVLGRMLGPILTWYQFSAERRGEWALERGGKHKEERRAWYLEKRGKQDGPWRNKVMQTWIKSYLVAAAILQSLWSISLAFLDIYAILVKRSLQSPQALCFFTIGDGITSTLTFAAACASAGITVLIGNDLGICSTNNCTSFETATALAFISWFAVTPSFLLNFWSLASR